MSYLSLDWGQRYVGYASSDEEGIVITPRGYFERKATPQNTWKLSFKDFQKVQALASQWECGKIILGLPLNADGSMSGTSGAAKKLAEDLKDKLNIDVVLVDERFTSESKQGQKDHARAAALILESYFRDNKLKEDL
jgi:putative Holliday junction resolvase